MHDLPSGILLQQAHSRPISGEELEVLGKQAACKYVEGCAPTLSAAVVETVKSAGLSPEQVRRVVEFANTDAYLQDFKKEGAQHRFISFDGGPADPSEVLKDLNDGGGGTVFDHGGLEHYLMSPEDVVKHSSVKTAQQDMNAADTVLTGAGIGAAGLGTAGAVQGARMGRHLARGSIPSSIMQRAAGNPALQKAWTQASRNAAKAGVGKSMLAAGGALGGKGALLGMGAGAGIGALAYGAKRLMGGGRKPQAMGAPQEMTRTASANFEPEESAFEEMWQLESPPEYPYGDPYAEIVGLRDKLASSYDNFSAELTGMETLLLDVDEELYWQVKQASLEGIPLSHVVQAWSVATDDPEHVKIAFQFLTPRLMQEQIFPSRSAMAESLSSLEKVAGVFNPAHPLIARFAEHIQLLEKMAAVRRARDEAAKHLDTVNTFMKEAATADQVLGYIPKAVKGVFQGASRAGGAAERAIGGTTGKVVGTTVKATPYAGAALGLQEAHDRYKHSPKGLWRGARGAARATKGRLPFQSAERAQRIHALQMGY